MMMFCCYRHAMLMVCREFQILINETREKALKAIAFSKTLRKGLEDSDFKQEINPECNVVITKSLEELKVRSTQFYFLFLDCIQKWSSFKHK